MLINQNFETMTDFAFQGYLQFINLAHFKAHIMLVLSIFSVYGCGLSK